MAESSRSGMCLRGNGKGLSHRSVQPRFFLAENYCTGNTFFSWVSDEEFLIVPSCFQRRHAIGLMRHPCLMATSPGRPVRALLSVNGTIRNSNILHGIQRKYSRYSDFQSAVKRNEWVCKTCDSPSWVREGIEFSLAFSYHRVYNVNKIKTGELVIAG